jgi:paired amphipathic helix protein Sin3a
MTAECRSLLLECTIANGMCCVLRAQVQSVLGDNRSHELWELMQKMRAQSSVSQQDVIRYRREAEENVAGDDHLYRFDWVCLELFMVDVLRLGRGVALTWLCSQDSSSQTLGIRLMNSQDPSVDGGEEPRQRWREYVDSFIMRHPTEWQVRAKDRTGNSKIGRLFLKRYVIVTLGVLCLARMRMAARAKTGDRNVSEGGQAARVLQDDLKIRISLGSYRLFYGAGGEETVFRKEHSAIEAGVLEERARARREERGRVWVAKYRG